MRLLSVFTSVYDAHRNVFGVTASAVLTAMTFSVIALSLATILVAIYFSVP